MTLNVYFPGCKREHVTECCQLAYRSDDPGPILRSLVDLKCFIFYKKFFSTLWILKLFKLDALQNKTVTLSLSYFGVLDVIFKVNMPTLQVSRTMALCWMLSLGGGICFPFSVSNKVAAAVMPFYPLRQRFSLYRAVSQNEGVTEKW